MTPHPAAPPAPGSVPLSVVVLTRDEGAFIARCLEGVRWAAEILVVDSESADDTRERAAALGARVEVVPWRGWVGQREAGMALARHDWIFFVDADEIVDEALGRSIAALFAGAPPDPDDGFSVDRRDRFFGTVFGNLRNRARQDAFVRIFNRTRGGFDPDRLIHEEVRVPGRSRMVSPGIMIHCRGFDFREQMRRYVDLAEPESQHLAERGVRASALKVLAWPALRFLWIYVARGGWRRGGAGLVHALMIAASEYLRWARLWERQHGRAGNAGLAPAPAGRDPARRAASAHAST